MTKGKFVRELVTCRNCGYYYTTYHEKMTDVNIANAMLIDAIEDACDVFILISGDSDLVNPIRTIRNLFPSKRIVVIFPPHRKSEDLVNAANAWMFLPQSILRKSVFPDPVVTREGFAIHKPATWR
ncbi:MAG: NYN domain-containing protein [Chloroflexi bacterium]|nr:NYN domain-containing protein [Chloroflexota bacterium]